MSDFLAPGRRASSIAVALNGALALIKLVAGLVGNSYALVADAIESFADIFSSVIVWGGLVVAAKPADRDHPYGHGKAEPLAVLAVSGMLLAAALMIASQAIHEIRSPHEVPEWYTLPILIAIIVIKESMYRYQFGVATTLESTVLAVDAWHHRSDALTSLAAALGVSIALLGGPGFATADDWAALLVCVVVLLNGLRFANTAMRELMDAAPDTHVLDAIPEVAREIDGARRIEKVLMRKMGWYWLVDLHLEVDPQTSVYVAHGIAHQLKDALMARWPRIADVLIHIEPYGGHVGDGPPQTGDASKSTQTTPSRTSAG